jgi:hypothetical protein
MYKELFKIDSDLSRILIETYNDIIHVNKLLVVYFQQRRKTAPSHDLGFMLTTTSLDRSVRHDMEAAQIKINEYHISHDVPPQAC